MAWRYNAKWKSFFAKSNDVNPTPFIDVMSSKTGLSKKFQISLVRYWDDPDRVGEIRYWKYTLPGSDIGAVIWNSETPMEKNEEKLDD